MVLENNGDPATDLTITATGASIPFTFKATVTGNYKVTVKTQPSNPSQNCAVTNDRGTATANVTNVQVTCVPVFTLGGSVSGLQGTGLVLANNLTDTVGVSGTGNVSFTFPTPQPSGASYSVTIKTQPANPPQICVVVNGTGTMTSNINTVGIVCPQPTLRSAER